MSEWLGSGLQNHVHRFESYIQLMEKEPIKDYFILYKESDDKGYGYKTDILDINKAINLLYLVIDTLEHEYFKENNMLN